MINVSIFDYPQDYNDKKKCRLFIRKIILLFAPFGMHFELSLIQFQAFPILKA